MRLLRLLKTELAADARGWVERGILEREQAERILAEYGATLPDERRPAGGYYALLALASVLLGFAVIVLVGANWDAIPRVVRLLTLVSLTAGANMAGVRYFLRGRERLAQACLLGGALVFGAGIFLVGQMYHLGLHWPEGVFFWAVGVFPMALLTRGRALMTLGSVIAMIWIVYETVTAGFSPLYFAFVAAQVYFVARLRRSMLLFMVTIVGCGTALNAWLIDAMVRADLELHAEPLFASVALFFVLYLLGRVLSCRAHPWAHDYGALLHVWTVRFALVALLPLCFEDPWRELLRALPDTNPLAWGAALIVAFASAVVLACESLRTGRTPRQMLADALPLAGFATLFGVLTAFGLHLDREALALAQIVVTVWLVGAGAWLVARGVTTHSATSFYLGVATVLATAVCRYVELVGDYLGTAGLFFACGLALIAAARFWRASGHAGDDS